MREKCGPISGIRKEPWIEETQRQDMFEAETVAYWSIACGVSSEVRQPSLWQADSSHQVLKSRVSSQAVIVRLNFEVLHLQIMRCVGLL